MPHILAIPALAASLITSSAATTAVEPPIVPQSPNIEAIAPNLSDPSTEIIDIDSDQSQRYTLPVTVEGAGPFNFMIDTGSQATAVTHQINGTFNGGLGLTPYGTATLVGMASSRPVDVVEVEEMTFGNHTVSDILSPVLDRRHVGADGIIGLDALQDLRVLIDFREETIAVQDVSNLRRATRGFEIIVNARRQLGQLLITEAWVEGVKATVIIDTGAQGTTGNSALRERLRTKRAMEVTSMDVNGVQLVGDLSYIRALNVGGITIKNVGIAFADPPAFEALGLKDQPVISLGMQQLAVFDRIAIDFTNQRVLFDVPRDVARALRRQKQRNFNALAQ